MIWWVYLREINGLLYVFEVYIIATTILNNCIYFVYIKVLYQSLVSWKDKCSYYAASLGGIGEIALHRDVQTFCMLVVYILSIIVFVEECGNNRINYMLVCWMLLLFSTDIQLFLWDLQLYKFLALILHTEVHIVKTVGMCISLLCH